MGGKPPGEFLGTPSKSVIYHPRSMSGKFGTIGRHVTIFCGAVIIISGGLKPPMILLGAPNILALTPMIL